MAPALSFRDKDFNLSLLSQEFSTLYELFLSNQSNALINKNFICYLDYLCDLLISYYQADYVADDLIMFQQRKKVIAHFIEKQTSHSLADLAITSPPSALKKFNLDLNEFIHSYESSAKIRKHLSSAIRNRSYWNSSRSLSNNLIAYLQKNGVVDTFQELNERMGIVYKPEELIELLDKPQTILRILGFALYGVRFLLNLTIMVKHIILAALNPNLSSKKVIVQEVEKRSYTMSTDLFWGSVNALNYFGVFWGIAPELITGINLFFLIVDIVLFLAQWLIETNHSSVCMNELILQKEQASSSLELAIINRQMDILIDQGEVRFRYYLFNIAAASLLALVFAATMLLSGTLTFVCLAAASMLGNALYNTAEEYRKYSRISISLDREQSNGQLIADEYHVALMSRLNDELKIAEKQFWDSLIFNTGFVALIITAAAVSWPIALSITTIYIAYKLEKMEQPDKSHPRLEEEHANIYRLLNVSSLSAEQQEKNHKGMVLAL